MNNEEAACILRATSDTESAPALLDVDVQAHLDGPLLDVTVRQRYANRGPSPIEVVYTFPLPARATLLGFASELNGQRQEGVVVSREAAEETYENALADGDAPVMLERLGSGLHTANIGNLNPGDSLVIEMRLGQLATMEAGRVRVSFPSTIAPRYGRAEDSGLQPQHAPTSSLLVEYPLRLALE